MPLQSSSSLFENLFVIFSTRVSGWARHQKNSLVASIRMLELELFNQTEEMKMTTTRQSVDQRKLQSRWQERCRRGNFSSAVLGVGTIRVFGKPGDAPITFPRIASLAMLDLLDVDERWAIEVAQEMVNAAQAKNRPVMAMQPPRAGATPDPTHVRTFDPKAEHILILSLTRGG